MSIITREAELKYPAVVPGMDPAPLRSGYMDGADREWTDTEIEAGAQRLYYQECNAAGLFLDLDWAALPEGNKADYRSRVRGILETVRATATKETAE